MRLPPATSSTPIGATRRSTIGYLAPCSSRAGAPWLLLERLVRPLAARIGFRSDFSLREQILDHGWQIESIRTVNLFGLSRLIHIRNR